MKFPGFLDREFIGTFFIKVEDAVKKLPNTFDGRAICSMMCKFAVMAILEEKGQLQHNSEEDLEFSELVTISLFPFLPIGARSLLDDNDWEALWYIPWNESNSVWKNLMEVGEARSEFQDELRKILSHFPCLTEEDKQHIVAISPVIRSLNRYHTEREMHLSKHFSYSFFMEYQRAQLNMHLNINPNLQANVLNGFELFKDLPGKIFAQLHQLGPELRPMLIAHQKKFVQPPNSSHEETFLSIMAQAPFQSLFEKTFEKIQKEEKVSRNELKECLLKLLFMASYQAAHQLLMSERFLDYASRRSSRDRYRSGFHFWYDLNTPVAKRVATDCLDRAAYYFQNTFPGLSQVEIAYLMGFSPLCIFLELIRLGIHL